MAVIERIRKFFMRSASVIEPAEADPRTVAPEPVETAPAADQPETEKEETAGN
ncbi:MAG TPA: hypothetical protein VIH05_05635 [Tepidiformaceae bacterium]